MDLCAGKLALSGKTDKRQKYFNVTLAIIGNRRIYKGLMSQPGGLHECFTPQGNTLKRNHEFPSCWWGEEGNDTWYLEERKKKD